MGNISQSFKKSSENTNRNLKFIKQRGGPSKL